MSMRNSKKFSFLTKKKNYKIKKIKREMKWKEIYAKKSFTESIYKYINIYIV